MLWLDSFLRAEFEQARQAMTALTVGQPLEQILPGGAQPIRHPAGHDRDTDRSKGSEAHAADPCPATDADPSIGGRRIGKDRPERADIGADVVERPADHARHAFQRRARVVMLAESQSFHPTKPVEDLGEICRLRERPVGPFGPRRWDQLYVATGFAVPFAPFRCIVVGAGPRSARVGSPSGSLGLLTLGDRQRLERDAGAMA